MKFKYALTLVLILSICAFIVADDGDPLTDDEEDEAPPGRPGTQISQYEAELKKKDTEIELLNKKLAEAGAEIARLLKLCKANDIDTSKPKDDKSAFNKLYNKYRKYCVYADGRYIRLAKMIEFKGSRGRLPQRSDELFRDYAPDIMKCYEYAAAATKENNAERETVIRFKAVKRAVDAAARQFRKNYEEGLPDLQVGAYGFIEGFRIAEVVDAETMSVEYVRLPAISRSATGFDRRTFEGSYNSFKANGFRSPNARVVRNASSMRMYFWGWPTKKYATGMAMDERWEVAIVGTKTIYNNQYLFVVPYKLADKGLSREEFERMLDLGEDPTLWE